MICRFFNYYYFICLFFYYFTTLLQISTSRKGRAKIPLGRLQSHFVEEGRDTETVQKQVYQQGPPAAAALAAPVYPQPTEQLSHVELEMNYRLKKLFVKDYPPQVKSSTIVKLH